MATVKVCDRCHNEHGTSERLDILVPVGAGELGQLLPMRLEIQPNAAGKRELSVSFAAKVLRNIGTESERWRPIDLCLICQLAVLEHAYRQAQGAITPVRRFVEHPPAPQFVVHILRAGWTFCGWDESPAHWPSDHRWVEESRADAATCSGCLEVLALKKGKGATDA